MAKNGTRALEEFLETEEGERFLDEAKARARVKAEAIEMRRSLDAERSDLLRRQREVKPDLDRKAEEAWARAKRAKAEYTALREVAVDAGRAAHLEFLTVHDGIRRTETALLRSADARILAGIVEAGDVIRSWPDVSRKLFRSKSESASSWDGTDSWVKRAGNNQAGIDALRKGIEDAEKALELLAIEAEPSEEDIAEGIARVKAAIAAAQGDPPPMVMIDYDSNGRPKPR